MIAKPGREESSDPLMYRPISLLNTEGKILQQLLIKRIQHRLNSTDALNGNQSGFTPQKNTVDATMEVRQFIEPHLEGGGGIIASLDVQEAFGSAWCATILKGLREAERPRYLYYLTQGYLKDRKAIITINNISIEKKISKGCPQGSCCGPGLWNIQFDPLQYTKHTKAVAFADDLLIMVRAESVREAENITNVELNKISKWARENKLRFNEREIKDDAATGRKEKRSKRNSSIYV